jgi:apolipoprotein N-acyltransferase
VERPGGSRILTNPIICYEALFSNYVLDAARKGSQLITNITNDSWFGSFGEPQLHLALTTFRSIESRLPQVRATNTGISAYISATGELVQQTQIGVPEIMQVQVPITPPIFSLVKLWGDWFGMFSFAMGALILGRRWLRSREKAN